VLGMTGHQQDDDVMVHLHPSAAITGGGYAFSHRGRIHVVIDPALDAAARRVVLAHELVHVARGACPDRPGLPRCWDAIIRREEARVDRLVASRLVPENQLQDLVDEARRGETAMTIGDVADAFAVTTEVATQAVRTLATDW
jgi:hypothetical protein